MTNLVLLVGIPAVGKSTFARTFFDLKYSIVSSDEIRKRLAGSLKEAHGKDVRPWDVFYQEIEDRLAHDVDVVADATFLTRKHRERARTVAAFTGSKIHLVVFKDLLTALRRNALRDEDSRVPENVMEDMVRLYRDTLAEIIQELYDTVTMIERFD